MANDSDPKDQQQQQPEQSQPQPSSPAEPTVAPPPPTPSEPSNDAATAAAASPLPRSTLIEQALRFLTESEVQNSTRTKKAAFLESKGLTRDEIDVLLPVEKGVPRWQVARAAVSRGEEMVQAEPPMPPMPVNEDATRHRRLAEAFQSLPPRLHDRPPIVTFPEYIPPPPPPPPIFNTATLTASAYLFAGVSATIYAATKYYFQPLIDNLTDSRLEFSAHALEKLDEMNAKLSELAHRPLPSETHPNPPFGVIQHKYIPKYTSRGAHTMDVDDLENPDGSDVESIYSYESSSSDFEATKTFHVDAQTQTSPPRSTVSIDDDVTTLPPDEKLDRIQRLLKSLKDEAEDVVAEEGGELGSNVKDLTEYLHNITYKSSYGGLGGSSANSYLPPYVSISGGAGKATADEDEFSKVKAEIRSVKGVLLNIKNFPSGSR